MGYLDQPGASEGVGVQQSLRGARVECDLRLLLERLQKTKRDGVSFWDHFHALRTTSHNMGGN